MIPRPTRWYTWHADDLAVLGDFSRFLVYDRLGTFLEFQPIVVDGSGLPGNYITPTASAQLMAGFNARPEAARWQSTLPTMGKDGSLATVQRDSPAAGHVFAKTGTLGAADLVNDRLRLETKALGGYIDAQSGRRLAVSIIVNQAMFNDIQGVFAANEDLGKIATAIYEKY